MIFHGICNFKGVPSCFFIVPSFEDLELYRKDYQSCGRLAIQSWTCWLKSPSPNLVGDFFLQMCSSYFLWTQGCLGTLECLGGVLGFDVFNFLCEVLWVLFLDGIGFQWCFPLYYHVVSTFVAGDRFSTGYVYLGSIFFCGDITQKKSRNRNQPKNDAHFPVWEPVIV